MRIFRICREKRSKSLEEAFNGIGASKIGGRWNPKGFPAVYTSESTSLVLLEILVHADLEDLPNDLVRVSVFIPDYLNILKLTEKDLPLDWRNINPAPSALAEIGKKWISNGEFLLMSVPSAIIPDENHYILNPEHTEFINLSDFRVDKFEIDPRLGIEFK